MSFALGRVKEQALLRAVLTVLLILGLLEAVSQGIEAVSSVILSFNFLFFLSSFVLLKSYSGFTWKMLLLYLAPASISSAIMFLVVYYIQTYMIFAETWHLLVISIIAGIITYGLCIFILPFKQLKFIREKITKGLYSIVK